MRLFATYPLDVFVSSWCREDSIQVISEHVGEEQQQATCGCRVTKKWASVISSFFYSFTFNCLRSFKIQSLASHTNKNTRDDIFLLRLPQNSAATHSNSGLQSTPRATTILHLYRMSTQLGMTIVEHSIPPPYWLLLIQMVLLPKLFGGFALALS